MIEEQLLPALETPRAASPEAGAVFLWVHAGQDQPAESVALLEAVRGLGLSAPGWCGPLAAEAEAALAQLRKTPSPRHAAVPDPAALHALGAVLWRAAEKIAAAAQELAR